MENNLSDYEEITQGHYRNLKSSDPKNYHSYTARIGHKYYLKKKVFPIVFEDIYTKIEVYEFGIKIIRDDCEHYFDEDISLPLLVKAFNKWKEVNQKK